MSCGTPLADGVQLIGVLLILAGAVGYLTLYFRRAVKGNGGGCGKCDCGTSRKPSQAGDLREAAVKSEPFISVENLGDLAARHREKLDKADRAGDSESPST